MATVDKNFKIKNGLIVGDSTNLVNYTSASPFDPFVGQFWIDDSDTLYAWSGSAWVSVGGGGSASGTPFNIPNTLVSRNASGVFTVGGVDLDTSGTVPPAVGRFQWNSSFGVPEVGLTGGNVTAHIGQHLHAYVTNAEGSPLVKGDVVYLFGASGDRASVKKAINTGDSTSAKTLGVVAEAIGTGGQGFVTEFGVVGGLNLSAYSPGDILYLSASAGKFTNIKPSAPNHTVFIGVVQRANAGNGQLFVNIQNGYELEELHNVSATNPLENDILSYNQSASLWVSQNLATAITEVDGAGSGIDADLLDGYNSDHFAPTSSATFTGYVNVPEPIDDSNAATKKYVDDTLGGQSTVVSSASSYPVSATQHSLFFNTSSERMAIRVGSIWKEFAFVSDFNSNIDNGNSTTTVFNEIIDGGNSSTIVFVNNYSGGNSE